MERLPNLFESYEQPENKLTFALLQTLSIDDHLARAFVRWAIPGFASPRGLVSVYSQRKPAPGRGFRAIDPELDPTIPDGWLAAENLLVALEVKKDPGALQTVQLKGHLRALARREGTYRALLVLTPDPTKPPELSSLEEETEVGEVRVRWRGWREVHAWACAEIGQTIAKRPRMGLPGIFLLRRFREYMEMSEISGFAGVVFDEGYDYHRAKAILKALRQEIAHEVLRVDGRLKKGRGKITDDATSVWDVYAREGKKFTSAPHFTLTIHDAGASLSLTIPDKAGQAWGILARLASERTALERALGNFLRAVLGVHPRRRPTARLNLMQRHWPTRSGPSAMDARLIARLDTTPICPPALQTKGVQQREGWYEAFLNLLAAGKGKANWEFQIGTHWDTGREVTGTPQLKDEMIRVLQAFRPLYRLVSMPV